MYLLKREHLSIKLKEVVSVLIVLCGKNVRMVFYNQQVSLGRLAQSGERSLTATRILSLNSVGISFEPWQNNCAILI